MIDHLLVVHPGKRYITAKDLSTLVAKISFNDLLAILFILRISFTDFTDVPNHDI